jgi:hypothetical protein
VQIFRSRSANRGKRYVLIKGGELPAVFRRQRKQINIGQLTRAVNPIPGKQPLIS